MRRTRLPVIVAAVLAAGLLGASPGVALAGPESDIPGIPLPGTVASGQLGGPIYDVVYRVDVPPASVLVAALTGSAGTDFDLYLFSSTATSVVEREGLISQSIGPTSTEQLSFATAVGGTFYIDLNGATDVQGSYTLTVQIVPDPTPPQASILLAGGAIATSNPTVDVVVGGFEDLSGVPDMSLSTDGITFREWEALRPSFTWTFSGADGPQRLWVRVRNGVGAISVAASDAILLDRVAPAVRSITPARDTSSPDARPTISVRFNEPIEPTSWLAQGLIMQSASGAIVPGTFGYDPTMNTGTFRPSQDLPLGMTHIVNIGAVTDLAGNRVATTGSWTIKRLLSSAVTLLAQPATVPWGASVTLAGSADAPAGSRVTLEARASSDTMFSTLAELQPGGSVYATTLRPARNTWYRAVYAGTPTVSPATSATVRVLVRRLVSLVGVSPATSRTVSAGRTLTLTALARPERSGIVLSFRAYRWDSRTGRYVFVASYGRRTDEAGRATLRWLTRPGRWAWRVAVLSDADYASNMSPMYRWTVR